MKKPLLLFSMLFLLPISFSIAASVKSTQRIPLISNSAVTVWKTIILPQHQQLLSLHRHDRDRVIIALTDGLLKITNDKGQTHYLQLKKEQAYFLNKDTPHELHTDENKSGAPIKVIVIELKA